MHPFSVAELLTPTLPKTPIRQPKEINSKDWDALWTYGGFPEPFIRRNSQFLHKWQQARHSQLIREDVRLLTQIIELDQLVSLATLLALRSGEQIVYASLAGEVRVAENTVRTWVATLASLHYGFLVRPWFNNVAKGIRKTPKWFLRDWSEPIYSHLTTDGHR